MTAGYERARHQQELAFFGRLGASISHEIKNKLAILKGETGLINDLIIMAGKGSPLDISRILNLMPRVESRIQAIDDIVKRLNRFSHSVDETCKVFDVSDLAALVCDLCQRLAAMKRVKLEVESAPEQVQITSDPFLVEFLLFQLFEEAMIAAGEGGSVKAAVRDAGEACEITFSGSFSTREVREGLKKRISSSEDFLAGLRAALLDRNDPGTVVLRLTKGHQGV